MSERKVRLDSERLYKNRANQGIDEMIFELSLTGKDMHDLQKIYLYNKQGFIYGSVEAHKGKATLNLNLPRYVRGDNMQPFSLSETIRLEIIKNDCEEALKTIFRDSITAQISKIEVNITQPICGRATQGEVLNLLSHATMAYKHDNIKYVGRSKKDKKRLKEEFHTVITRREKYWIGKFYDKSEQLIKERLERQLPTDDIPKDLLRIEIIFVDRTLTKLFGDKKTLSDVLKTQNITMLLKEYKRVFCQEIIKGMVSPYYKECINQLIESLSLSDSPIHTIAKHREIILDTDILQKALKHYMDIREKTNNSARDAKRYAEQFDLPRDVLMTILAFVDACG